MMVIGLSFLEHRMKNALIIGLVALATMVAGCDLYRTMEGVGIIGPNGGWFVCYDQNDCNGD
jgi:predicted small secreted protein